MNMFKLIANFVFVMAFALNFSACAPGPEGSPMGSSSGGGGYGDESGNAILKYSVDELLKELQNANPSMLKSLPKTLSAEKIISLLKNVKADKSRKRVRDGVELLFDYDEKTNTIYATRLFFDSMASEDLFSPTLFTNKLDDTTNDLKKAVYTTKLKLLHEIAHIGGFGQNKKSDPEARAVAFSILNSLMSNYLICAIEVEEDQYKTTKWQRIKQKSYDDGNGGERLDRINAFIIHRPSLRGAQLHKDVHPELVRVSDISLDSTIWSIYEKIKHSENDFAKIRGGNWFYMGDTYANNSHSIQHTGDWMSLTNNSSTNQTTYRRISNNDYARHCEHDFFIKCDDKENMVITEEILSVENGKVLDDDLELYDSENGRLNQPLEAKIKFNIYTVPTNAIGRDPVYNTLKLWDISFRETFISGALGYQMTPVEIPQKKLVHKEEFSFTCLESTMPSQHETYFHFLKSSK